MHFVTQLIQVSRHPRFSSRRQFFFGGKRFWQCGLWNPLEALVLSPESAKDCWHFNYFYFFIYIFFFLQFGDQIIRTVFPKHFFSLLKILGCQETGVNCVTKCVTAKIFLMKVQVFYRQLRPVFYTFKTTLSKQFLLNRCKYFLKTLSFFLLLQHKN